MAPIHAKNSQIVIGGYDLSSDFSKMDRDQSVDESEVAGFGATAKSYVIGLQMSKLSLGGWWNGAVNAVHARLEAILGGVNTPVTVAYGSRNLGDPCDVMDGKEKDYKISGAIGSAVGVTAEIDMDFAIGLGTIGHPISAESASSQSASVDWGATSTASNGFDANMHLTGISGAGATITARFQDSADNVTFVDIANGTFTALTAVGGQSLHNVTSVRRYTRAGWVIAGTAPSCTFLMALAKR